MKRLSVAMALGVLLALGACGGDDDPANPGTPESYSATVGFWNFLVADGSTDTRLDFFHDTDSPLATNVLPLGGADGLPVTLAAASSSPVLGYKLSYPGAVPLEASNAFPMNDGDHYRIKVCGVLGSADPDLAPRMVQMEDLAAPATGSVTLRVFHALAGSPVAVDIHVNGRTISGLNYAEASDPVSFAARSADQDTMLIVPAGQAPNGSNEIIAVRGASLFSGNTRNEVTLVHQTSGLYNGDVNGEVRYTLFTR